MESGSFHKIVLANIPYTQNSSYGFHFRVYYSIDTLVCKK